MTSAGREERQVLSGRQAGKQAGRGECEPVASGSVPDKTLLCGFMQRFMLFYSRVYVAVYTFYAA